MSSSIVVVTGAAGALGRTVVAAFLARGASVLAVDLNAAALAEAWSGRLNVSTVAVDLTDATASMAAITGALDHRPASALCNIAGGFDMGPAVHATGDALWRGMMDLNVGTLINASAAVVPAMLAAGAGRVVNVSAASAGSGLAAMGAYCAAKSAVARLTESMSAELRAAGINVNAVAPGMLDTPANRAAMPDADPGQWVSLGELAAVIAFLASPDASAVHGAVIPVRALS